MTSHAYDAGFEACTCGSEYSKNPYEKNTWERRQWDKGWRDRHSVAEALLMVAKKKVWCAQDRYGLWCARNPNKKPRAAIVNVRTKCGDYITLPYDIRLRVPTCAECIAKLKC